MSDITLSFAATNYPKLHGVPLAAQNSEAVKNHAQSDLSQPRNAGSEVAEARSSGAQSVVPPRAQVSLTPLSSHNQKAQQPSLPWNNNMQYSSPKLESEKQASAE